MEAPSQFKHQQVEAAIRRLVQTLPIGARLPAERGLAETHACNFLTVRRALKALVDDGTVVRRVGSGTFVAKHAPESGPPAPSAVERLGVLVWQDGGAYAYRVLQGVAQTAPEEGVELRSSWVRDFARHGADQAKVFASEGCRAITLPWFPHDRAGEVRDFVRSSPLPVSLPLLIPGLEKNCFERQEVFGDSLQGITEQLCEYFRLLGHERIAFVGPDMTGDAVLQRMLSAYACQTSRANLPNYCGLVRPGAPAMDQLAERWRGFRGDLAVICYDDEHALRFMTSMHKLGLRAPADYRIVGHNDTEASAFSDPPLTTIGQNFDYVGRWLIRSARALARGGLDQSADVPRARLIVRESCGGRSRIDEPLRAALPRIDLVLGHLASAPSGE